MDEVKKARKSSKIGLKNTHIAEYDPLTHKFSKPVPFTTIKSMKISLNMSENDEYNDDGLFEVLDSFENFEIEVTYTDLTPAEQAFLLGWKSDGAIRLSGANDDPPWIAFMGERTKKDKSKRFFKYFRGKARLTSEEATTKGGGSVTAQPDILKITFGALPDDFPVEKYRDIAMSVVDESDPIYKDEGKTWYEEVIKGQTETEPSGEAEPVEGASSDDE